MPSPDPARILRQHVQTDALLGVDAVPVPMGVKPQPPSTSKTTPKPAASAAADAAGSRPTSRPTPASDTRFSLSPAPARPASRAQAPPLPPARAASAKLLDGLSAADKQQRLDELAAAFEQDDKVQATRPPNTNLVFGEGDVDAKLMFIGEGPGETEDRLGRPFVGPAGELLDKMIKAMGMSRDAVYFANVVKYRPPGNRTPTPEEAAVQGAYLARQAAIVRPAVMVALGGAATKFALQTTTGITRLRGTWASFTHTDPVIPLMPTFHPAYLLRSYTPDNRKKVWSDLQAVMEKIGGG